MPILETGQIFASGDQVTSQKLMDIAGLARFDDPADEVTIQVDTDSGKLKVPANGITGNELASDGTNDSNRAVDTNHLKDESVTSAKLAPAAISAIMPTGSVMPFAGRSAPDGFLVCDGSAISRTTYSALFAVIEEIYGSGDGSTTFNLPDLQGRVVAGRDNMSGSSQDRLTNKTEGIDGDTLGATGGKEDNTLTAAQSGLPAHVHKVYSKGHGVSGFTAEVSEKRLFHENAGHTTSTTDQLGLDGQTGNNDTANASTAHNNVQPTIILNYIIKT